MIEKETWVTYLLWFFFGFVGVHKFYLGKVGWGVLYLLTGGLFFVGWLIDLFTIPAQVREVNAAVRSFRAGGAQPVA
jgi:TM2 domain-containing membrane protein YozV